MMFESKGNNAIVLLDGVRVDKCISADEASGKVVAFATDAEGRLVINAAGAGLETIVRRGVVRVERPAGKPYGV